MLGGERKRQPLSLAAKLEIISNLEEFSKFGQIQLTGTLHSQRARTVKNGVLRYTLIGVVEKVLFQHPCLASIIYTQCGYTLNWNFAGENGG